jgi:hypothetical protein
MVIPTEYIQIISAGIYAIALFYTVVTFRRTKRLDQITLSNNIFSHLRDLDIELAKIPAGSQYNDVRGQWYSRIFNSVNWLSFMINEKVLSDKKMVEHFKSIIVRYYEDTFLKNASVDEKDFKSYPELEKLYRTIKK